MIEPFAASPGGWRARLARAPALAPLAIRKYRTLWASQIFHSLAMWVELVARPFLVLEIVPDAEFHLGGVLAAAVLPQLLLGLWAGAITDWFDRRRVLLIDKLAAVGLCGLFTLLIGVGRLELWHVYAYSLARGAAMAFDQPAR